MPPRLFARISSLFHRPDAAVDAKLGMAWYKESQWSRLREVVPDAGQWEKTYDAWQQHAQNVLMN